MSENNLLSLCFRKEVLELSSYHVANAAGLIKLDAMENPYTWPDQVKAKWLESLQECELNRYPDPEAAQLSSIIRRQNKLSSEFNILLGNGSDELIQMLLMALPPNANVLTVQPSFVMYQQISRALGLNVIQIPLVPEDFSLDLAAVLQAIETFCPKIIFLAYPNNPTGNLFDRDAINQIINVSTGLVVIDEAYEPFANASFMAELPKYENLLVMRTLSKLGLAGLRLGYLVGATSIIQELDKVRLPYNINVLTQKSAAFALENQAIFEEQTQQICSERGRVFESLLLMDGVKPYPSAANFILVKTEKKSASDVFTSIKKQGVLIKNLSPQGGLLEDCLRVTIGKPDENDLFLNVLWKAL
jgi:histidinol-phosphate aminotransferase